MGRPDITEVDTAACDPPHRVTHPRKMWRLSTDLATRGWCGPALIGYRADDDRVQLLSGSHRHAAAEAIGRLTLPVRVYPEWFVRDLYGDTQRWAWLMTP